MSHSESNDRPKVPWSRQGSSNRAQQANLDKDVVYGKGTIGPGDDFAMMTAMTPEAELPLPKRTIVQHADESEKLPQITVPFTNRNESIPHRDHGNDSLKEELTIHDPPATPSSAPEIELTIKARYVSMPGEQEADQSVSADYAVVKKLGEGGMGEVWLAYQKSLGREIALKQIRSGDLRQMAPDRARTARDGFLTEAVITGGLNHPNIVPVYDMGTDADGNLLYSMKCVRGFSWDKTIHTTSEAENIEILRKVADAIGFAHSRGVVHRDLKPANIMVGSYGEVLVMDWGTALPLAHFSRMSGMRPSPGLAGTPVYMPPEQAVGDVTKIGPHSDVYLLGALLFEIAAGCPPHPMSSPTGSSLTLTKLLENAVANKIVQTDASGELLEIALKAMRTDPRDRYPSIESFVESLKNYQKHAESVMISKHATADLETANLTRDYSMYSRALHGFENALSLWEQNYDALSGLMNARLDYSSAALQNQDFDLGLSLVNNQHPVYRATHRKLLAGQRNRQKRIARLRVLRWVATLLVISLFAGGTVAGLWINAEKKAAIVAKDDALEKGRLAQEAEKKATSEKEKAEKNESVAKKAKEEEEEAKNLAVEAKKETETALKEVRIAKGKAIREWYYAQINLADQQVAQNAFDSARETLDEIEKQLKSDNEKPEQANGNPTDQTSLKREVGWELQRLNYVCGLASDKLGGAKKGTELVPLIAVAVGKGRVATANQRGKIEVWTKGTPWEKQPDRSSKGHPSALAISPKDEVLAVGDTNGLITIWDLENREAGGMPIELRGHEDEITRLMYLPEGQLVSTSRDHTARVWNVDHKSSIELKGHVDAVLSLARVAGNNGETVGLITGKSNRGEIRFWNWPIEPEPRSKVLFVQNESIPITALAVQLRTGKGEEDLLQVYAGTDDGNIKAIEYQWSLLSNPTGKPIVLRQRMLTRRDEGQHGGAISRLIIDPSRSDRLISTSRDNTIRTWNVARTALIDERQSLAEHVLRGHGNAILDAVAWKDESTRGTRLLTASTDGTARFWRPDESAEIVTLGGATLNREANAYGEVSSVSVGGSAGEFVMAVSRDGVASVWNLSDNSDSGSPHRISLREGHRFLTQSAIFLKDAFVTTSFDGTAVVWSTQTGSAVEHWRDVGTSGVLAGSADGRWVITGYSPVNEEKDDQGDPLNLQLLSLSDTLKGQPLSEIRKTFSVGKALKHTEKKAELDAPSTATVSSDGNWGLVGTENGYLNLVDLNEKLVLAPTAAHLGSTEFDSPSPEGVTGVAFLSDTDCVSAGLDGTLRFWKIQDRQLIKHPTRQQYVHSDNRIVHRVVGLVASADGRRIATRLRQGKFRENPKDKNPEFQQIWITDIGDEGATPFKKLQSWGASNSDGNIVTSLSITADGTRVMATVAYASNATSIQKQTVLHEWKFNSKDSSIVQAKDLLKSTPEFDFRQALYLPGEVDRIAILSDTLTSIRRRTKEGDFTDRSLESFGPTVALQACDISNDGTLAVTISDSIDPATDQPEARADSAARRPQLQGEIRIWKINGSTGQRVYGLPLAGAVRTVAMSPLDSNLILVGGNQRNDDVVRGYSATLYRWTGKELTHVQTLGNHKQGLIRCRFSRDGKQIVSASGDGSVEVFQWVGNQFQSVRLLNPCSEARMGDLITVDLSDDGKLLAAADVNGVWIYNVQTGQRVIDQLIQGHSSDLTDVRFAARLNDEAPYRFWTTSLDGTVKFWGLSGSSGQSTNEKVVARSLLTLRGHLRGVLAMATLPNGGVATAGKDGRVILWPIKQVKSGSN